MYCTNCGVAVDENAIFCTRCGKRLKNEPAVTAAEQPAPENAAETAPVVAEQVTPPAAEKTAEPVVTVAEQAAAEAAAAKIPAFIPPTPAVDSSASTAAETEQAAPACTSFVPADAQPPVMPFVPEKQAAEKVYFGKGALVFCLVVIGLLAISTGVFAGLYASLL